MKHAQNIKKSKRKYLIAVIVVAVALSIDLSPFGGNIRFYLKWSQCGVKPVQVQSRQGIAWYKETPTFMPIFRNTSLYCTPIEAERAGYSASKDTWDFPYLEATGEQTPFEIRYKEFIK